MLHPSFPGLIINLIIIIFSSQWVLSEDLSILSPDSPQLKSLPENQQLPSYPPGALTSYTPNPKPGFVTTRNGHLYLDGKLFDFRNFNSPELVPRDTVYEITDMVRSVAGFATPATRAYSLGVANERWGGNQPVENGHISGWDVVKNDWIYNENVWRRLDKVLAILADEGVKVIFPIINQDYGKVEEDWVGNFNDLIRHRYNVSDYRQAELTVDWFVDKSIREDFKKIIHYFLTRKNTVNGRIYGQDDTFLAIETGNEMNWSLIQFNATNITDPSDPLTSDPKAPPPLPAFTMSHNRSAPAEWTLDIAQYIKSLAPNILVMDGSYYQARVEAFGKTFIVGEHGFYSNASAYEYFYKNFKGAGALVWSLRGHSEPGGFITHSEGNNIYSLHVPGFQNQTSKDFDQLEYEIVRQTYRASFDILGKPVAPFPVPGPPHAFFATNSTNTGISFKGSAWAAHYEIWGAVNGGSFVKVADNVLDNVNSGKLFFALDPSQPEQPLYIPPLSYITIRLPQVGWKDDKWYDGVVTLTTSINLVPSTFQRRSHSQPHHSRGQLSHGSVTHSHSNVKRQKKPAKESPSISKRQSKGQKGGWYAVRAIGVDNVPGGFSQAAWISASDDI
ncbi:family 5 glycoside hydrolase [Melampsora larici-populina 98AG31]|uniref:Family 5 glycoside hydrolase n=1 Tax=Melampsora larici-populina (strain 98AG31 / pathotype 3-4-7) TaxID=747676 RepID=F4RT19_MELLP|nr:family 5 glycoside hydrolase [Melampsora larici-populina 98AG31]EGG04428.1 family 5 glycoside hydrolase [Melampsora larici-populina 98AG31]